MALGSPLHSSTHPLLCLTAIQYKITGDTAWTRTVCYNPMVMPEEGGERTMVFGLWYIHEYVRTSEGWRISERVEEQMFLQGGMPRTLTIPD